MAKFIIRIKGGSGSGNFQHEGREGEVGGSAPKSGRMVSGRIGRRTGETSDTKISVNYRSIDSENPSKVYHNVMKYLPKSGSGVKGFSEEVPSRYAERWGEGISGYYDPNTQIVYVSKKAMDMEHMVLHEIGHGVVINGKSVFHDKANPGYALEKLEKEYKKYGSSRAFSDIQLKKNYGLDHRALSNPSELAAESFVVWMRGASYQRKNLLSLYGLKDDELLFNVE